MPKGKGALYYAMFSKTGQDVCKWLAVPWVTASQEQLLEKGVPKGFFPGSNPCGGC